MMAPFQRTLLVAPLVALLAFEFAALAEGTSNVTASLQSKFVDFTSMRPASALNEFAGVSPDGKTQPAFLVREASGSAFLTENGGSAGDSLYLRTTPTNSLTESYAFRYDGPASVVEPFLVNAGTVGRSLSGFGARLEATKPDDNLAGDLYYEYHDRSNVLRRSVLGRLRTEPYLYEAGHVYQVDVIADGASGLFTTRLFDRALGPTAFDLSIKGILPAYRFMPGLRNAGGGRIQILDFSEGPVADPPLRPHFARRASEYLNYLGYNSGLESRRDPSGLAAFQAYFPRLGIRHIRVSAEASDVAALNVAARYGIDTELLTSNKSSVPALQALVSKLARKPDAFELWNEPNNSHEGGAYDPNFAVDLPPFAASLRAAFPNATIWGPSILPNHEGFPSVEKLLSGSISPYIDGWNTHAYAVDIPETSGYGRFYSGACGSSGREDCGWYGSPVWNDNESAVLAPGKPGIVSEGGGSYGSYPEICGHGNVDASAQQAYVQRGMLYDFKLGLRRIFPYKFIDDSGCSDGFGSLGIMSRLRSADGEFDVTPKPAYTSLVYFDRFLRDDGAAATSFEPKPLTYGLSNATPHLEELLLAESDGSYRLILWNDEKLWDFNANGNRAGIPISKREDRVSITFSEPVRTAAAYQTAGTGRWTIANRHDFATETEVQVSQYPMVLDVMPRSANADTMALASDVPTPGPRETPREQAPR